MINGTDPSSILQVITGMTSHAPNYYSGEDGVVRFLLLLYDSCERLFIYSCLSACGVLTFCDEMVSKIIVVDTYTC